MARETKMADEHPTRQPGAEPQSAAGAITAPPKDPRNAIIDALMELAGERNWEDITISDVAARANVSLATFRDLLSFEGRRARGVFAKDRSHRS